MQCEYDGKLTPLLTIFSIQELETYITAAGSLQTAKFEMTNGCLVPHSSSAEELAGIKEKCTFKHVFLVREMLSTVRTRIWVGHLDNQLH